MERENITGFSLASISICKNQQFREIFHHSLLVATYNWHHKEIPILNIVFMCTRMRHFKLLTVLKFFVVTPVSHWILPNACLRFNVLQSYSISSQNYTMQSLSQMRTVCDSSWWHRLRIHFYTTFILEMSSFPKLVQSDTSRKGFSCVLFTVSGFCSFYAFFYVNPLRCF